MRTRDLPPEADQEWLIEALGELVEARGHQTLLEAPLRLPTPEHFPDPWTPDLDGAAGMIARVLLHAGLEGPAVIEQYHEQRQSELGGLGDADPQRHQGTAAWYAGFDEHGYRFGVEDGGLNDPEQLAGTLSHEVAHAYRHRWDLCAPTRDVEEQLTDLTTVYLGFGVLTANASYSFQSRMLQDRPFGTSQWQWRRSGYLQPEEIVFALAAWAIARGENPEGLLPHLGPTQRVCFERAWDVLSHRPGLLEELGLPEPIATEHRRRLRDRAARAAKVRRFAAAAIAAVGLGIGAWLVSSGAWAVAVVGAGAAAAIAWRFIRAARHLDAAFLLEEMVLPVPIRTGAASAQRAESSRRAR